MRGYDLSERHLLFGKNYTYIITDRTATQNCASSISITNALSIPKSTIFTLYYWYLNSKNYAAAHQLLDSQAGITLTNLRSVYENIHDISFQSPTFVHKGNNIYEYFVSMTENGVEKNYKIEASFDEVNFRIHIISSVLQ